MFFLEWLFRKSVIIQGECFGWRVGQRKNQSSPASYPHLSSFSTPSFWTWIYACFFHSGHHWLLLRPPQSGAISRCPGPYYLQTSHLGLHGRGSQFFRCHRHVYYLIYDSCYATRHAPSPCLFSSSYPSSSSPSHPDSSPLPQLPVN